MCAAGNNHSLSFDTHPMFTLARNVGHLLLDIFCHNPDRWFYFFLYYLRKDAKYLPKIQIISTDLLFKGCE